MKKYQILFIFTTCFFLVSCQPSEADIQKAIAETQTAMPTSTPEIDEFMIGIVVGLAELNNSMENFTSTLGVFNPTLFSNNNYQTEVLNSLDDVKQKAKALANLEISDNKYLLVHNDLVQLEKESNNMYSHLQRTFNLFPDSSAQIAINDFVLSTTKFSNLIEKISDEMIIITP
jgi:hypothetical protein